MIIESIFTWAERTPEKTAVIYNEQFCSYRSLAGQISIARGYFLKRGYLGRGYAVLALYNQLDFWILSLALRSLGLTTVALDRPARLDDIELPDIRCVIASPLEAPSLEPICKVRSLALLSVSLEGEHRPDVAPPETRDGPGGHILLTSGTTGRYKMVLNTPAIDAAFMRAKCDVIGLSQESVVVCSTLAGGLRSVTDGLPVLGLSVAPR